MEKIKINNVYIYSYIISFIIFGVLFYLITSNVKNNEEKNFNSANEISNNFINEVNNGKSLVELGDYKEAVEYYENKDNSKYEDQLLLIKSYLNYGNSYYVEKEYADKALTLLDSMQEKYETFFYKGYAYEIKQDYVKALELYNKAKDIKDISLENKAIILNQIGHVYDLMGDFNKANELYTESENLGYELMGTIINRGRSEFRLNNFEKAKEYFEKILSLSDNKFTRSEVYYNLSVIYLASNDYEKVIDYAKLGIESNENYPNNYISLGVAYIKNGGTQIDETPELFNKAIKIYPNSSVAYKWLGVYYYIKDDFDNAIINFEKQYETSGNNIVLMQNEKDSGKQEALYDLARVYALKNDAEKSIYYLNQVLDGKNIAIYTTFIEDIAFTEGPFGLIINDLSFAKNTENIFKLYKK
ncbi:MAG: hypothetical protein WC850_01375 [Candidatus Gracilibacteria bacterium]